MKTSSNGNIIRVFDHLCGEFTGPRWIPRTKGQPRGALICAWINGWVNNRLAGDLGRYHAHYDVTVMIIITGSSSDAETGMFRENWVDTISAVALGSLHRQAISTG